MKRRLLSCLVALVAGYLPGTLHAQFTDPRTYGVAPVGLNQLELDYTHAEANAALDTSVAVFGAHVEVNQGTLAYTHNFAALGHLTWLKASMPFASVSGSIAGTGISKSITGAADLNLEFAALLMGGRALSTGEFANYEPTTTLGLSVTVSAPTGEYNPDKVLNLGSHRWSFKPEFAVAHPFGPEQRWEVDGYINVYFFTDNTEYKGVEVLRQDPLPGLEGHISYDFTPTLWASLDARYSFRGATVVDGLDQDDAQRNLTVGAEANWSPRSQHSLTLVIAKALVHQNAPEFTGFVLKYVYSWGGGPG